jgi:hypothetical protein
MGGKDSVVGMGEGILVYDYQFVGRLLAWLLWLIVISRVYLD